MLYEERLSESSGAFFVATRNDFLRGYIMEKRT
jgi:hypothetical protein